jgi:hypothetical protein
MDKPKLPGRLPVGDFVIHLVSKISVVVVSGFLVPSLILLALFFMLRWGKFDRTAFYLGEFALVVALGFCLIQGFGFNSKRTIRRICAGRRQPTTPLFRYRHPIVRDAEDGDTLSERVHRVCAIAVIEAKGYTIAFGVAFLLLYLVFLYFLRNYDPASLRCTGECAVGRYWIKSIGTGPMFDFFETFRIPLTNVDDGSYLFRTVSYLAKIVSTLLVLQTLLVYFGYRRRFRWVLRREALGAADPNSGFDEMLKDGRPVLGPGNTFVLLPPWIMRRFRSNDAPRNSTESKAGSPPDN